MVDIAVDIIDSQGQDALGLSSVAARAGVAPPSLYKHVASLGELRTLVAVRVLEEMTDEATSAVMGLSGDAAIVALMRRMRAYVVAASGAVPGGAAGPDRRSGADRRPPSASSACFAVLRCYDLQGPAAIDAVRTLRVHHRTASPRSSPAAASA